MTSLPELQLIAIDISAPLKIKASDISKYLLVSSGDAITEGSVLAKKKSFLGVDRIEIQSPVNGIIHSIDINRGVLLVRLLEDNVSEIEIKQDQAKEEIIEERKEEVKPIQNNPRKKRVSVDEQITSLVGFGEGKGKAWYIEKEFSSVAILPEMKGKILLVGKVPTILEMYKASAVGVEGIITTGFKGDVDESTKLQQELENKTTLGFLLLPDNVTLNSLHNKLLEIKGKEKHLLVLS
jgi:hypothetical protein